MRTSSPLKKLARALPSKRLSSASKRAPSLSAKPGSTQGRRARPPCPATSARKNAPWLHNRASMTAGKSAHPIGSPASPAKPKLGTKIAAFQPLEEQSSYFSADIAVKENNILIALIGPSGPQQSRGRHVRPGSDPSRRRRGSRGIARRHAYWRTEDWIAVVLGFLVITAVLLTFQWKVADLRSVVPTLPLDHERADRTAHAELEQGARPDRARRRGEGTGEYRRR